MALYRHLRARMKELGMSSGDLAAELHMEQATLSHRMSGRTQWRSDEMYAVLRVCNAPPEEMHLFFPKDGKGEAAPATVAVTKQDAADEAAAYLSGFIRCIVEGARA